MSETATNDKDAWVAQFLGIKVGDASGQASAASQGPESKLSVIGKLVSDAKNVISEAAVQVKTGTDAVQQAALGLAGKAGEAVDGAVESAKGAVGWGTPPTAKPAGPVTLTSKTEETNPAPRTRTKLGVGERVVLTVSGGTGNWTCSGGKISAKTGTTVTLTAPPRPGDVEVEVDVGGTKAKLTFTVIAPNKVNMVAVGTNHTSNGTPNAGMTLQPYFGPDDVNFVNVSFTEDDIGAKATGCWEDFNGIGHSPNPSPLGCSNSIVSGKGTLVNANDNVQTGWIVHNPPLTDWSGTLTFNIPWRWHCGSGTGLIERVLHKVVTNAAGSTTISKGGATFTAALS